MKIRFVWFGLFALLCLALVSHAENEAPQSEDIRAVITRLMNEAMSNKENDQKNPPNDGFNRKPHPGEKDRKKVDVSDVIQQTLQTHPDGKIGELKVDRAKIQRRGSYAGYHPQASVYSRVGQDYLGVPVSGMQGLDLSESGIQVTLRLWDWGVTRNGVRSAKSRVEESLQNLLSTQISLGLRAGGIFLTLLRERLNSGFAQRQVETLDDVVGRLKKWQDKAQPADISLVKSRLAKAASELERAKQNEEDVEIEYEHIVGVDSKDYWLELPGFIDIPADRHEALQQAFQKNPQPKAYAHAKRASKAEEAGVRGKFLPRFEGVANGSYRNNFDGPEGRASRSEKEAYFLGARLVWDWWDGGKRSTDIDGKQNDQKIVDESTRKWESDVTAEIRDLYRSLEARAKQIRLGEEEVRASADAVEKLMQEVSKDTPPDISVVKSLLDMIEELHESRVALNALVFGYVADLYALHAQIGTLLEVLKVSAPTPSRR